MLRYLPFELLVHLFTDEFPPEMMVNRAMLLIVLYILLDKDN